MSSVEDANAPQRRRGPLWLLTAVALCALACSPKPSVAPPSPTPAAAIPERQPVVSLEISEDERYYQVTGASGDSILASLEANAPVHTDGTQASGLTSSVWDISWETGGTARCRITTMQISVDLTVTLPQHQGRLGNRKLIEYWRQFDESVRSHEMRHVAIERDLGERLRTRMEALAEDPRSCRVLEGEIDRVWEAEHARSAVEHDEFDRADRARIEALRKPLERQIDRLERQAARLESRLSIYERQVSGIDAEMSGIESQYPSLVLPEPYYSRYADLQRERHRLVGEYNSGVTRYNSLAKEVSNLVDEYNWTH